MVVLEKVSKDDISAFVGRGGMNVKRVSSFGIRNWCKENLEEGSNEKPPSVKLHIDVDEGEKVVSVALLNESASDEKNENDPTTNSVNK